MEVARGLGLISSSFLGRRGFLHSSPTLLQLTQRHSNWGRSEDMSISGNAVHADAQASISWSLRVRNAVFPGARIAIQRKCSCVRIEDWIYIVMGCPQTLGLPCRRGSSLVALLGSIFKAGDVESCCRAKRVVFICSDMPASSKVTGLAGPKCTI